jgi:hypothetical protein
LLGEQTKFWQTTYVQAHRELATAGRRSGAFAVVPGLNGALGGKMAAPVRDFITFPDTPGSTEQAEQPRSDRRAA